MYTAKDIRNICLLGHGGDGKSALAESMLFLTKSIDRLGKRTDGNTASDFDPEEIRRGYSISTSVLPVEYHTCKLNILDNPGYFDFAEVQAIRHRPMYMSDYVEQLDNILRATGEEVLTHAGKISHAQAMEKAKAEYKRYQAQTLSPVEEEYLKTIKQLGKAAKTEAEKQDDSSDPS